MFNSDWQGECKCTWGRLWMVFLRARTLQLLYWSPGGCASTPVPAGPRLVKGRPAWKIISGRVRMKWTQRRAAEPSALVCHPTILDCKRSWANSEDNEVLKCLENLETIAANGFPWVSMYFCSACKSVLFKGKSDKGEGCNSESNGSLKKQAANKQI